MQIRYGTCAAAWSAVAMIATIATCVLGQSLEEQLRRIPPDDLARAARAEGDAVRGAVLFFQPYLACSKCHPVGDSDANGLGPDLTTLGPEVSDAVLVEALLEPSKRIRQGFQSVTVATVQGQLLQGLLVEQDKERVVIRDVNRNGEMITLSRQAIEEIRQNSTSIMPSGQLNQLVSPQQFYDLVRYLMEVRDGGAPRARELRPSESLVTISIPEYEARVDHAGIISEWNADAYRRGEVIYRRVCGNCHGTLTQPGSLPTAPRFAEYVFKNGCDPYAIYQTLTRGFGLMPPQSWMVPVQKYDVIHYIRETFLREHNPSQYVVIDSNYLAKLPQGDTRGPEPSDIEPWSAMDYGPTLTHTYEVPGKALNIAYKGMAVRLDSGPGGIARGRYWMLYETDTLRVAAAWSAGDSTAGTAGSSPPPNFIDWRGIQFNGEHQIHPRITGHVVLANPNGPGWADPRTGSFQDTLRVVGRDGRRYGPLPREWARFRGYYLYGHRVVLSYTVGTTPVLESPDLAWLDDKQPQPFFLRRLNIGSRDRELLIQVADLGKQEPSRGSTPDGHYAVNQLEVPGLAVGFLPHGVAGQWLVREGRLLLRIAPGNEPLRFTVWWKELPRRRPAQADPAPVASGGERQAVSGSLAGNRLSEGTNLHISAPPIDDPDLDLSRFTRGGPPRWPQRLETPLVTGRPSGPFAVDIFTAPESNPWLARLRFTGLDFLDDRRLVACTWDGDVWLVENPPRSERLLWQRIATGLFQPLGIKVVGGKIFVTCRDQIAVLHDLNGDREIDYYECFNNDHQVTEHFHEFAMGLQIDKEGNFYYAKSARHALPAIVPHHGTLLRVSPDGLQTTILATGFRAANGVCVNPDGSFFVTDQEGHWIPKNRINWVTVDPSGSPKFYGNMFGYHDVTDTSDEAMEKPLCWITNSFDRSPAELLWVESPQWGALNGALLNLSYGYGKIFLVLHERVGDLMQGGMIALPLPAFPTGIMRGRFHSADGNLYVCGMFAWAGNATHPGGLYRVRPTGQPLYLPTELHARVGRLVLRFTEPLDRGSLETRNVRIKLWDLKRTANYGSKHFNERYWPVERLELSEDGRTLTAVVPELAPTWCMEIAYDLKATDGAVVQGVIHNTIHVLAEHDSRADIQEKDSREESYEPVRKDIQGWTVYVDPQLLDGPNSDQGSRALSMLSNHLERIRLLVPTAPLERLQRIELWIEWQNPRLTTMQYHPSRQWLVEHGFDPRLAKKVHIPRASQLLSREQMLKHPAVVLHELAHAYHDQVLGFDHGGIEAAYEQAKQQGIYENVLLYDGRMVRHYGLTNAKEYFAEGTEAFFYRNDFYPFVRAELARHDPRLYELLKGIWEDGR